MNRPNARRHAAIAVGALMLTTLGTGALADKRNNIPLLDAYQQECAACHVAFPPRLLPADSWQRLMANLPRHFGTDASIDAAQANPIEDWLVRNASTRRTQDAPAEDRITRSAWFEREHRKVPQAVWTRASVKSPSNCAACHTRADQGDFNEHTVRIPR